MEKGWPAGWRTAKQPKQSTEYVAPCRYQRISSLEEEEEELAVVVVVVVVALGPEAAGGLAGSGIQKMVMK